MSPAENWPLGMGDRTIRAFDRELVAYIQRKTGSREAARDIAQDVWLASRRFRGEASARHFLYSVARRRVADWFRSRRDDRVWVGLEELVEPGTSVVGRVERAEMIRRLRAGLSEVREPFQGALRLWLAGMRGPEIAEAMGCSENTVRSRLSRGRRMLLEALR